MRRVIAMTGAAGFVGRALVQRLRRDHDDLDLVLSDARRPDYACADAEVVIGDLSDRALQAALLARADTLIHLASLPGGAAEADHDASRRINLDLTLDLMHAAARAVRPVRFIYASSIAVFGAPYPARIDDATEPRPVMTYGAHKRMAEIALADLARKGALDAVALRLPGVVARPSMGAGLKSAFMSGVFHADAAHPLSVPVGPDAQVWLMSVRTAARNFAHAAMMGPLPGRALTLPALRVRMADLADAIGAYTGRRPVLRYEPDAAVERQFGALPPLDADAATAAGFAHDGDLPALVANVYAGLAEPGA